MTQGGRSGDRGPDAGLRRGPSYGQVPERPCGRALCAASSYGVGRRFFLTGGAALAPFCLGHRLGEDLDLFTLSDGALDAVAL